jgi:hypothetical protein
MSTEAICRHNGYHRPGQCPEANEAAGAESSSVGGVATEGSEACFYGSLVLRRGDAMEPVAHAGSGRVIGAVRVGDISIHSTEPEALVELAGALRVAAGRMEALRREGAAS